MLIQRNGKLPLNEDFANNVEPLLGFDKAAQSLIYGNDNLGWWISELKPIPSLLKKRSGVCPECNTRVLLRENGNLASHFVTRGNTCSGSGGEPVQSSKLPKE